MKRGTLLESRVDKSDIVRALNSATDSQLSEIASILGLASVVPSGKVALVYQVPKFLKASSLALIRQSSVDDITTRSDYVNEYKYNPNLVAYEVIASEKEHIKLIQKLYPGLSDSTDLKKLINSQAFFDKIIAITYQDLGV